MDLTLIGMSLLIMALTSYFILIYWAQDPTAYEHDDLFHILVVSQLLMIYICLFVLGVELEAHD